MFILRFRCILCTNCVGIGRLWEQTFSFRAIDTRNKFSTQVSLFYLGLSTLTEKHIKISILIQENQFQKVWRMRMRMIILGSDTGHCNFVHERDSYTPTNTLIQISSWIFVNFREFHFVDVHKSEKRENNPLRKGISYTVKVRIFQ